MSNGGFVWGHTPADDMKNIDKRGFDQPIDFSSELINYLDSLEKYLRDTLMILKNSFIYMPHDMAGISDRRHML